MPCLRVQQEQVRPLLRVCVSRLNNLGKTLALLCSTLSWQAHECSENLTKSQKAQSRDVSSKSDGLLDCNGGDEVVSKSVKEFERKEQNKALEKGRYGDEKNTQPCKIFFASRTQRFDICSL